MMLRRQGIMEARLRIGKLARASELTIKAIRYYETRGLLPPSPRTEGYRLGTTRVSVPSSNALRR